MLPPSSFPTIAYYLCWFRSLSKPHIVYSVLASFFFSCHLWVPYVLYFSMTFAYMVPSFTHLISLISTFFIHDQGLTPLTSLFPLGCVVMCIFLSNLGRFTYIFWLPMNILSNLFSSCLTCCISRNLMKPYLLPALLIFFPIKASQTQSHWWKMFHKFTSQWESRKFNT